MYPVAFIVWGVIFWPAILYAAYLGFRVFGLETGSMGFTRDELQIGFIISGILLFCVWLRGLNCFSTVMRYSNQPPEAIEKIRTVYAPREETSECIFVVEAPNDEQELYTGVAAISRRVDLPQNLSKGSRVVLLEDDEDAGVVVAIVEDMIVSIEDADEWRVWFTLENPDDYERLQSSLAWNDSDELRRTVSAPDASEPLPVEPVTEPVAAPTVVPPEPVVASEPVTQPPSPATETPAPPAA